MWVLSISLPFFLAFSSERDLFPIFFDFAIAASDYHQFSKSGAGWEKASSKRILAGNSLIAI